MNESALPIKAPSCPAWLGKEGKAEWRRMAKLLVRGRQVTELDRGALTLWCEAWQEFCAAAWAISEKCKPEKEGGLGPAGLEECIALGLVNVKTKAASMMLRAGVQLGLTPAARTRVKPMDGPEERDEMDELLDNMNGAANFRSRGVDSRKRG